MLKVIHRYNTEKQMEELDRLQELLSGDDGRPKEERMEEFHNILDDRLKEIEKNINRLSGELSGSEERSEAGAEIKEKFWKRGEIYITGKEIVLRKPQVSDKEGFLAVQKENSVMPHSFKMKEFRDNLWQSQLSDEELMCTIMINGEYAGYCGIKNVKLDRWEAAIELLKVWTNKGVGSAVMTAFFDAVSTRLGVSQFRIRIESDNYASQRLFEKLGAKPNGISEYLLHGADEIHDFEEKNLSLIDDKIKVTAKKFNVEPRELLSHVLEYELTWNWKN